jgi:Mn2+/Fe2+ NRAMP family transporter
VVAPPLLVLITLLGADRPIMKQHVSGKISRGLTCLAATLMAGAAVALFVSLMTQG